MLFLKTLFGFVRRCFFVLTEHLELKNQTFTKYDGLNLNPVLKKLFNETCPCKCRQQQDDDFKVHAVRILCVYNVNKCLKCKDH